MDDLKKKIIKFKLELKIKDIKNARKIKNLESYIKHLNSHLISKDYEIDSLLIQINKVKKQRDAIFKYHNGITHLIKCQMCMKFAILHQVYNVKGICMICKEEIDEVFSSTCGHTSCFDCSKNLINHYDVLKG